MRILIIGNSGSGKTFKGKELSKKHDIPIYELDNIVWKPNGYNEKRDQAEIEKEIEKIKSLNSWIVEGVFGDIASHFLEEATELIWLDEDWEKCHSNLKERGPSYNRYSDPVDAEKAFKELIEWASKYWDRENSCSYKFHKNMANEFKRKNNLE